MTVGGGGVALALRYVGTAGRSNHLHPAPSASSLTIIYYLLFLTSYNQYTVLVQIDSEEIVDENIRLRNNDQ